MLGVFDKYFSGSFLGAHISFAANRVSSVGVKFGNPAVAVAETETDAVQFQTNELSHFKYGCALCNSPECDLYQWRAYEIFFIIIMILAFSGLSFAAKPVKLSMELTLNGKPSHPTVITNFGEIATVSMVDDGGNGYQITILPTEFSSEGKLAVKLEMELSKVENKVFTKVSTPKIITLVGEEAKITQSGKNSFELSVTPTL